MDNVFTCVYRGCVVNPSVNTRMIVRRKLRCVRFVSATGHHPPSRQPRRGANASRARHDTTSYMYVHMYMYVTVMVNLDASRVGCMPRDWNYQ